MSDDKFDDKKLKFLDISKLNLEISDEKRKAVDEQLKKQFKELVEGKAAMTDALRGIGGVSAVDEVMRSANRLQDKIKLIGLDSIQAELHEQTSAIQTALASATALSDPWRDIYGLTAASRLAEEMRSQQALYLEPVSVFADIHSGVMADIDKSIQALKLPQLDIMGSLGVGRMADMFGAANVFQSIGLAPDFDAKMSAITSSLNGHIEALTAAQAMRDAISPAGLTDAIESLLTLSLAARKTMLVDYRDSAADAKKETRFNRRMMTLTTIINVLMFFMTLTLTIEDRLKDDDAAIPENTQAVRQMQQSFDDMATQVQQMSEMQEAATEQDRAADAAIADLLREIADSLSDQAETTSSQQGAATKTTRPN